MPDSALGMIFLIIAIVLLLIFFFTFVPISLWISTIASGVKVSMASLVGMRFRRINPSRIVLPLIKATKAGLKVDMNEMEAHLLAGGQRGPGDQRPHRRPVGQYPPGLRRLPGHRPGGPGRAPGIASPGARRKIGAGKDFGRLPLRGRRFLKFPFLLQV